MKKPKPPRERAARALCTSRDLPENTKFEGRPMWESLLPEVDIVLKAALTPEEWERIRGEDESHD
ncbi:hypothetical protein JYP49_14155 [Nitratireductor aquimarinus]|uniref:hypothetical protein n=1 Tax=Nitratireductor TaxID=245876 RepID=UPI0019D3E9D4|nr:MULTISPECIES: hypothetical protein [Nitratireductor]MBN7777740.1 hypothetical protein [Nitratireductor pacificus]MBN7781734.1 hypothetical protein [Nitratireductor pacificus]MBN7790540.1 hypothetical protein [Nitratireductor aquimarinus]MBY6099950.1 hypothetical protein [Nitratireductor aquimarinus]MCA1260416.1 hypothetical protein [Nitratireductor aquimarinus]